MDAVRAHERELTAYALERLSRRRRPAVFGPPDAAERGGLVSFDDRGRPPARHRRDLQPRGGRDPGRPPLRPAADAPPRRAGDRARVVLGLQHAATKSTGSVDALEKARVGLRSLIEYRHGRALPRIHPRPLQEPPELRGARAARRRVLRPQPALRRRDGRAHQARRRPVATCASTARAARSPRRPPRSSRTS